MYNRLLNIYIAARDNQLEEILQAVAPLERFSHKFFCSAEIEIGKLKEYRIIIIDFETVTPESLTNIYSAKDDRAFLIGCITADGFPALDEYYHLLDRIWTKPFDKDKASASFSGILKLIKNRRMT